MKKVKTVLHYNISPHRIENVGMILTSGKITITFDGYSSIQGVKSAAKRMAKKLNWEI